MLIKFRRRGITQKKAYKIFNVEVKVTRQIENGAVGGVCVCARARVRACVCERERETETDRLRQREKETSVRNLDTQNSTTQIILENRTKIVSAFKLSRSRIQLFQKHQQSDVTRHCISGLSKRKVTMYQQGILFS